jgi:hypothetical protein
MTVLWSGSKRTDNGNDKDEMRGSLHCAAHDETVSRFGRNDGFWFGGKEKDKQLQSWVPSIA